MIKFPKIGQFRNVIKEVRARAQFKGLDENNMPIMDRDAVLPKINYIGTVKLHGTNASVRRKEDGTIVAQSRNRVLSLENDNAGFANFVFSSEEFWKEVSNVLPQFLAKGEGLERINEIPEGQREVTIYGEWCGGNIQKGVAITGLDKMFVVFGIRIGNQDNFFWLDPDFIRNFNYPEHKVYNIYMFETFSVEIDFENPSLIQNGLVDITESVEKKCPVGASFGSEGIGEGVVWRPDPKRHPEFDDGRFWFKVKGAKHSDSKVKELAPIDPEKAKSITEFVNSVTTDHRLEKGIDYLNEQGLEISKRSTGHFLKWLGNDVLEEEADVMEASNLDRRDVMKYINEQGKRWFFAYLDNQADL